MKNLNDVKAFVEIKLQLKASELIETPKAQKIEFIEQVGICN